VRNVEGFFRASDCQATSGSARTCRARILARSISCDTPVAITWPVFAMEISHCQFPPDSQTSMWWLPARAWVPNWCAMFREDITGEVPREAPPKKTPASHKLWTGCVSSRTDSQQRPFHTSPAPSGGFAVALGVSGNTTSVGMPAFATIAQGATTAGFSPTAAAVSATTTATLVGP
jgi:hypothetical protein